MFIVVGLGNPEEKYYKTFHNMGFNAVDKLADNLGVKFKKKECDSLIAEAFVDGKKCILAKPLTYMNLSGIAVKQLLKKYLALPTELMVIYDDYDLKKGDLRIRAEGSAGTHNGMRNIVSETGFTCFPRIRIGIREENSEIPLINYVLSGVKKEDLPLFDAACGNAALAAEMFLRGNKLEEIMQKYNKK